MKAARLLLVSMGIAMLLVSAAYPAIGQSQKPTPANRKQLQLDRQLVILDTDIGDDIDDAFALALLLRSPEVRILGISTAFGDTNLRARLVDRYLSAVSRTDIPVTAGPVTPQSNIFSQAQYAKQAPERKHADAVPFLLDQIRLHPGQITLIAIGPLTNVEAAITRDPATFRMLKRVVLMGGSVYRGYGKGQRPPEPEWNIKCNPAAARTLLASGVPVFMMPLDSTQIPLEATQREQIFTHSTPLSNQLLELYREWKANNEGHPATPTLFDPVAVSYALKPELCQTRSLRLEVDNDGLTRPVEGQPNANVCVQSDEKAFMEFFLGRML